MMEWVPYHCNMNAELYIKTLQKWRKCMRKERPKLLDTKSFAVHYDNASSHHAQLVENFLNDMFVIPHVPHSPDLGPCDFFLFLKLKLALKGQHLEDLDGIKQKSVEYL